MIIKNKDVTVLFLSSAMNGPMMKTLSKAHRDDASLYILTE